MSAVFLGVCLVVVAFPAPHTHVAAVQDLERYLRPGDVLAVDGIPVEQVLPYLGPRGVVVIRFSAGFPGDFVLSGFTVAYPGFVRAVAYSSQDLSGWPYACSLWIRATAVRT